MSGARYRRPAASECRADQKHPDGIAGQQESAASTAIRSALRNWPTEPGGEICTIDDLRRRERRGQGSSLRRRRRTPSRQGPQWRSRQPMRGPMPSMRGWAHSFAKIQMLFGDSLGLMATCADRVRTPSGRQQLVRVAAREGGAGAVVEARGDGEQLKRLVLGHVVGVVRSHQHVVDPESRDQRT